MLMAIDITATLTPIFENVTQQINNAFPLIVGVVGAMIGLKVAVKLLKKFTSFV